MRIAVVLAPSLLLLGCSGDPEPTPAPDDGPVRVTGCDDPALWTAHALEETELAYYLGGGACSPAQYPLHRVTLSWTGRSYPAAYHQTVCWRVLDASAGSGWTAGQQFTTDGTFDTMTLMGFVRPVTLEGRVLSDDGIVAVAIAPDTIALDELRIVEPDVRNAIAVTSAKTWVERDAVDFWGKRIATDEIVDATSEPSENGLQFTVHRTASGLVWRTWYRTGLGEVVAEAIPLGPGTRARIARYGGAVVIDDELVVIQHAGFSPAIRERIPLGSEPLEVVGTPGSVMLHFPGRLDRYRLYLSTLAPQSLAVDDGVLLPTMHYQFPLFFDGARFHAMGNTTELAFEERLSFSPRADDLAALGSPVAVQHGIVFGDNGLLAGIDVGETAPGPRFASYADLFGDGHLGPLSATSAEYVITHANGDATLYQAPFTDWCD